MKKKSASKNQAQDPEGSDLLAELQRASESWLLAKGPEEADQKPIKSLLARVLIFAGGDRGLKALKAYGLNSWQLDRISLAKQSLYVFSEESGPFWVVRLNHEAGYGAARDAMGALVQQVLQSEPEGLTVNFIECSQEAVLGALVGLDLAAYGYLRVRRGQFPLKTALNFFRDGKALSAQLKTQASHLSRAVNLGRHLVNLPPNWLHPQSYAGLVRQLFEVHRDIEVEIWDLARLRQERMGLFVAVGEAATHPPCLVRIKYRPSASTNSKAKTKNKARAKTNSPLAFVGKGITFDSGGLNLKPSGNMRLMKKDMGGSASVMALAYWVSLSDYGKPIDFYLALAENTVDQGAFRPSDVLRSRSGLEVEVHNTDAEGRMVLADSLDVAITQKGSDEPKLVIDVATLTGAIKVGLGVDLAGLFSNDEKLSHELLASSQRSLDLCWPMPLHQKYRQSMKSTVADMTNAVDGFGGAVTAALFLESFVGKKPWAHLDIYAWKDSSEGPYTEPGASGQAIQLLVDFLVNHK